jgi:integrase
MSALALAVGPAIAERVRRAAAVRPQGLTVRDLIDRYMAGYAGRDTSLAQRLAIWREALGDFTLETLSLDVMREARAEIANLPALAYKGRDHEGERIFKTKGARLHANKTPATVNRYMAAISSVFTWAIGQGLTPVGWTNPCWKLKRLKGEVERVRFLDPDERTRLLEACKASKYPRLYAMVLAGMLTGARLGELKALTWRDVDLERGTARLGRSKNGDRRTLVLLPQVVEALRPFVGEPVRFVFGSVRERHQAPAEISTAWRHAVDRAKIADFRFHDLRHCCASYLAQAGKPINVIAEVLGHRKLDMARRYAHLTVTTKAEAMHDALGDIGK